MALGRIWALGNFWIILNFSRFEPDDSYKNYSYKKKAVPQKELSCVWILADSSAVSGGMSCTLDEMKIILMVTHLFCHTQYTTDFKLDTKN